MPKSLEPKSNNKNARFDTEKNSWQNKLSDSVSDDPDYQKLLKHFERAEFEMSLPLLEKLEKKYPKNPEIDNIKNELKMKLSLMRLAEQNKNKEKIFKIKSAFRYFGVILIGLLLGAVIFATFQLSMVEDPNTNEIEQEVDTIASLNNQAEQLLIVGNPEPAMVIIERIRSLDPEYENLPELLRRTEILLNLEEKYQRVLILDNENNQDEALQLLKEIEAEQPGLWDVSQRISAIENAIKIENLISKGNTAFQEANWGEAIVAYEEALLLAPGIEDQQFKEQLFRTYLSQIIIMLQEENQSIEQVNQAADYYRKAVALFPQSRQFTDEREDLQDLSSNLLELRYTQSGKNLLEDPYQNSSTIANAVSYLRKAAKIKPSNSALQLDLKNAEYYQIAFNDFIDMKWNKAIVNLENIVEVDPNYAAGNARILLFESYFLSGEQYYSAGFYQDAISFLEQAELLIWATRNDNLMRFFSTQILIGNTLGELEDYENAVSYYSYAANTINLYQKLSSHTNLFTKYLEANELVAAENYEAAYESFNEVLDNIDVIYSNEEIKIEETMVLAFFADKNQSTVKAIIDSNDLQKIMTIKRGQVLLIPSLNN